jgi:hypothetical protein
MLAGCCGSPPVTVFRDTELLFTTVEFLAAPDIADLDGGRRSCKRVHHADELTAAIVAKRLVEHLERAALSAGVMRGSAGAAASCYAQPEARGPRMSFLAYVNTCSDGIDPQGDFVRDAREDPHLPDAKTWRELESYLWETRRGSRNSRSAKGLARLHG